MKTLEALQKASEGKIVRSIKTGHEIECDNVKHLKGKNEYFDFNFMNLDDDWEVVEKKIIYNIRVYNQNDELIQSFNDEIEESKVKDYVDKVLVCFGSPYKDMFYFKGGSDYNPCICSISPYKSKVIVEPIKITSN